MKIIQNGTNIAELQATRIYFFKTVQSDFMIA